LNVIPIRIPPLRERLDDLPLLVQTFVERFSRELCVSPRWPTEEVMRRLGAYSWPGNVRELENVIKRALVLASGDVITIEDVEGALGGRPRGDWTEGARSEFARLLDDWDGEEGQPGPYWTLVQRLEGAVIRDALERCGGNQLRAARLLGINRNTLRKKMTELGIEPDGSGSG
jgi:two-component system nitrogen regulation response regulator GlnG